jgi:2',3'-cyclic-nucleotide 2'-phosphodiesterase (5'-nucleotidase family)
MKIFASLAIAVVAVFSIDSADAARNLTATIDILAYNDVYEMTQDAVNGFNIGGPSRVVAVAKAMRDKNPNSLVLFAGDTMSPSLWSSQFKGMQMTDAHKAIGVDFASLGNHEFDFGIEGFLNVSNAVNFPWLNANCFELSTGTLLRGTKPRAIKEFAHPTLGNIKIGLFGVMYDMKDSSKGLFWTDPIEAAKAQVAKLQAQKVDMIIALTHQDLADDNRLSKEVAGINVIYGGHDHASMLQTNFGTPYLKADFDFRSIWKSHIEYYAKDTANPATFRMTHTAVPITEDMPSDKALDAKIQEYATAIGKIFERVVGTLCEPLDLSNKVVRAQDAPIAHIFADAQLKFYGEGSADVSISNGGGIRTDKVYPAGPLTLGQVVAWSPFGNTIMITETDGASLKKFITKENLASCGAGVVVLNGFYAHPAGVKWTFKCTGTGAGSLTSLEWMDHPTRSGPVKDDEVLKLATNNFLYNTEFAVIPGIRTKVIKSEAEAVRIDAALEWYVKQQKDAVLCEKGPVRSSITF